MVVQLMPSVEDSQVKMLPLSPLNLSGVLFNPAQTKLSFVICPAIVGSVVVTVIVSLRSAHPLISCAIIFPPIAPACTVMEAELAPDMIDQPAGTCHS